MEDKWYKRGACKIGAYEPDDFFGVFERLRKPEKRKFLAKTCDICPVFKQCRSWAQENKPSDGLFAGEYWKNNRPRNPWGTKYSEKDRDERATLRKDLTPAA